MASVAPSHPLESEVVPVRRARISFLSRSKSASPSFSSSPSSYIKAYSNTSLDKVPSLQDRQSKVEALQAIPPERLHMSRERSGKILLCSCLLGLGLAVTSNELEFHHTSKTALRTVNIIGTILSIVAEACVYQHHRSTKQLTAQTGTKKNYGSMYIRIDEDNFVGFVEMLVCLAHPLPGLEYRHWNFEYTDTMGDVVHVPYTVNSILTAMCFLRMFVVLKAAVVLRAKMDTANAVMKLYQVDNSFSFALKTLVYREPMKITCSAIALIQLVFGYLCRIMELPGPRGIGAEINFHNTYFDSVWLVVTSTSTIGFGNVYPVTPFGCATVYIAFFMGQLVMAVTIAVVMDFLQFTASQRKVIEMREIALLKSTMRHVAGLLVKNAVIYHYCRGKLRKFQEQEKFLSPRQRLEYVKASTTVKTYINRIYNLLAYSRGLRRDLRRYLIGTSSGHKLSQELLLLLMHDVNRLSEQVPNPDPSTSRIGLEPQGSPFNPPKRAKEAEAETEEKTSDQIKQQQVQTQRSAAKERSDKGLPGQPTSLAGPLDQFTSLEDLTKRFERARGDRPAVQNPKQQNQQPGPSSGHEGPELFRIKSLTNHSESTAAVMVEVDHLQKQVARIDQRMEGMEHSIALIMSGIKSMEYGARRKSMEYGVYGA